jgi:hypothetical protein
MISLTWDVCDFGICGILWIAGAAEEQHFLFTGRIGRRFSHLSCVRDQIIVHQSKAISNQNLLVNLCTGNL